MVREEGDFSHIVLRPHDLMFSYGPCPGASCVDLSNPQAVPTLDLADE